MKANATMENHMTTRNWSKQHLKRIRIDTIQQKSKIISSKCANNCDERITMVSVHETLSPAALSRTHKNLF